MSCDTVHIEVINYMKNFCLLINDYTYYKICYVYCKSLFTCKMKAYITFQNIAIIIKINNKFIFDLTYTQLHFFFEFHLVHLYFHYFVQY